MRVALAEMLEKNQAAYQQQQKSASSFSSVAAPSSAQRQPYLAISHVRDDLVPLKERKAKQKVWDMAVNFLAANESRIRVESQRILGEDFDVWRWLPPVRLCCCLALLWLTFISMIRFKSSIFNVYILCSVCCFVDGV